MRPSSTFWDPGHIFGADKARHFEFVLYIERKEWAYTAVTRVKVLQYGGAFRVTLRHKSLRNNC